MRRDAAEIMEWVRDNQDRFRVKGSFDGYETWRFDGAVTLALPGPINTEAEFVEAVAGLYGSDPEFTAALGHAMDSEMTDAPR